MTSHVLYSSYHPHYIWNGLYRICVITTTLLMFSDQLYVWHHIHFTYANFCTLHNVTSTLYDFTTLYLSHYIHCIHDITHPIYDITHMAIETLHLLSDPLYLTLHALYLCHQTHDISYTTPTLYMTSYTLYVWPHIQYPWYHNKYLWHYTPLCITSHPVYLWQHIQYVRNPHTVFMTTQRLYLTFHPPYLTSQPLYLCHHTEGTHICIEALLYQIHHNKCVSCHIWHTYDITPNVHHILVTLYDINDHVLSHHKHCIHDIRSPLYDITSTL